MKKLLFILSISLFIGCEKDFSSLSFCGGKFNPDILSSLSLEKLNKFWKKDGVKIKIGVPGYLSNQPGIQGFIQYSLTWFPENERAKGQHIWVTVYETQAMAINAMEYIKTNSSWRIFTGGKNKYPLDKWWYTRGTVFAIQCNTIINVFYDDFDLDSLSEIAAIVAVRVGYLSE